MHITFVLFAQVRQYKLGCLCRSGDIRHCLRRAYNYAYNGNAGRSKRLLQKRKAKKMEINSWKNPSNGKIRIYINGIGSEMLKAKGYELQACSNGWQHSGTLNGEHISNNRATRIANYYHSISAWVDAESGERHIEKASADLIEIANSILDRIQPEINKKIREIAEEAAREWEVSAAKPVDGFTPVAEKLVERSCGENIYLVLLAKKSADGSEARFMLRQGNEWLIASTENRRDCRYISREYLPAAEWPREVKAEYGKSRDSNARLRALMDAWNAK